MPALHRVHQGRSGRPWRRVRAYVLQRDGGICWLCKRNGADSVDHVIPLSKGGDPLDPANLRAAHLKCNGRRQAALPQPVPSGAT
ncbi:MAG: HNH endonuclease, partial [Caulobacteraceae bacterium]|nr:HNH endonuclease [Caulobacteraceae bacterium]